MQLLIIISAILGIISTCYIAYNAIVLVRSIITARSASMVPIIGGACGALALLACPVPGAWRWAWLPIVLDPVCYLLAPALAVALLNARFNGRSATKDEGPTREE